MKRTALIAMAVCLLGPAAYGQSTSSAPSTIHVFPQAADGRFDNGGYFASLIWIYNTATTNADCVLGGQMASRFANPDSTVLANSSAVIATVGTSGPILSGFVVLYCSHPVEANLTYFSYAPGGILTGMATVLSAKALTSSMLTVSSALGTYGIAIANPTPASLSLTLRIENQAGTTQRSVDVVPNGQVVGFAHDLLGIPASGIGTGILTLTSNTPDSFYVMALLFSGPIFTTLVPSGPLSSNPDSCASIDGGSIFGSDGQFLGRISTNRFDSDSIANQFGPYGSQVSSTSILNSVSTYGSTVSTQSAFSEIALSPPLLVVGGQAVGYLTVNPLKTPFVNTWVAMACMQPSRSAF